MRLSELAGKRIIDLYNGEIIGVAGDSDLLFDAESGRIRQIVIPRETPRLLNRRGSGGGGVLTVPWNTIRKIGSEVIVVDSEYC